MGMGFILPFALTFVAIPLETFVHSLRTVLGLVGIGILRALRSGAAGAEQRRARISARSRSASTTCRCSCRCGSRAAWPRGGRAAS